MKHNKYLELIPKQSVELKHQKLFGDTLLSFFLSATAIHQKWCYGLVSIGLLVAGWLHSTYFNPPLFPLDDAYITLHNIEVLHTGYDRNYLGVSALAGATSPIHLALAALFAFWLSPLWALDIIQWLAIFIYAFGILRLVFIFEASLLQAFFILLLALTAIFVPYQLLNGLETGLAMAGVVWALVFASQPINKKNRILAPLLWGVLPFLRPELIILSALLFFRQGWLYWQSMRKLNFVFNGLVKDGLLMFASALPWIIWYWLSTGLPYPETMVAKEAFFAHVNLPIKVKLTESLSVISFGILMLGYAFCAMFVLLVLEPLGRLGLLFIVIFLMGYCLNVPYALSDNMQRYLYVCFPILLFGGIASIRSPHKLIRLFTNMLILIAVYQSFADLPTRWNYYLSCCKYTLTELAGVAHWCNTHLPPNATLLIHDAGYIAFATPFHLIDMVGLKTPSSIRYHQMLTEPSCGKDRVQALALIIQQNKPQYVVILARWDKLLAFTTGLRALGWQFDPLRKSEKGYTVYRIMFPQQHIRS